MHTKPLKKALHTLTVVSRVATLLASERPYASAEHLCAATLAVLGYEQYPVALLSATDDILLAGCVGRCVELLEG